MLHRSSGMLLSMRCCWLDLAEELIGWTDAGNVKSQSFLRGMGSLPATLWCWRRRRQSGSPAPLLLNDFRHGLTGSLAGFPVPETVPPEIIPELTGSGVGVSPATVPLFP